MVVGDRVLFNHFLVVTICMCAISESHSGNDHDSWHLPTLTGIKPTPMTTSACSVCGTVVPPVGTVRAPTTTPQALPSQPLSTTPPLKPTLSPSPHTYPTLSPAPPPVMSPAPAQTQKPTASPAPPPVLSPAPTQTQMTTVTPLQTLAVQQTPQAPLPAPAPPAPTYFPIATTTPGIDQAMAITGQEIKQGAEKAANAMKKPEVYGPVIGAGVAVVVAGVAAGTMAAAAASKSTTITTTTLDLIATHMAAVAKTTLVRTTLEKPVRAGVTEIEVPKAAQNRFAIGDWIKIEDELNQISGFGSLILKNPLRHNHSAGVTIEKVDPRLATTTTAKVMSRLSAAPAASVTTNRSTTTVTPLPIVSKMMEISKKAAKHKTTSVLVVSFLMAGLCCCAITLVFFCCACKPRKSRSRRTPSEDEEEDTQEEEEEEEADEEEEEDDLEAAWSSSSTDSRTPLTQAREARA